MTRKAIIGVVVCFLGATFASIASADFVAYSVGKKAKSPFPERVDDIDTKFLLNIEWGDYGGPKRPAWCAARR